jgi:ethanolamine-phosphate cytidylyltransferase
MTTLFSTLDAWMQAAADSEIVADSLLWVHHRLRALGVVEEEHYPISPQSFVSTLLVAYAGLLLFIFLHLSRRRRRLKNELKEAKAQLKYMQDKLSEISDQNNPRPVRIFMDGAFDLMHYGHMNAFRLGRSMGTHLVVGVNSDESIAACKAAPLMNDQERLTMVSGCKFVDEVVPECPYIMNKEYLEYVIQKYKIDYVVHGDDPCIVDGKDVYASAKEAGKYRSIPRTEGVSTTDIVGRMLIMSKEHHIIASTTDTDTNQETTPLRAGGGVNNIMLGSQSRFLTTSRMLKLFSSGVKAPEPGMKVIYIDGSWDMFHPGHVNLLKVAKEVCTILYFAFLLVLLLKKKPFDSFIVVVVAVAVIVALVVVVAVFVCENREVTF